MARVTIDIKNLDGEKHTIGTDILYHLADVFRNVKGAQFTISAENDQGEALYSFNVQATGSTMDMHPAKVKNVVNWNAPINQSKKELL